MTKQRLEDLSGRALRNILNWVFTFRIRQHATFNLPFITSEGFFLKYLLKYGVKYQSLFFFKFQISFIRRRDFHILSNGHSVYTNDQRIEIFHAAKSHDWYLVIKQANHNDSGIYECQVKIHSGRFLFNVMRNQPVQNFP